MTAGADFVLVVAFASAPEAEVALGNVRKLDKSLVRDAAVVVRTATGHVELHQSKGLGAGEGLVSGGAAGVVAGLLLGIPVAGALVGILAGGGFGLRDTGIRDDRLRQLGRELDPGHAVLCVLAVEAGAPQVRQTLAGYGDVLEVAAELVSKDP